MPPGSGWLWDPEEELGSRAVPQVTVTVTVCPARITVNWEVSPAEKVFLAAVKSVMDWISVPSIWVMISPA